MAQRSRYPRYDHPPTLRDAIDATGYGWAVDLVKAVAWIGLVAGGVWLRYHVATTALTSEFQRIAPQPTQQATPVP